MKALIIGYGSIGKRHEEVLSSFQNIDSIDIVTKQTLKDKTTFSLLTEVKNINSYDYYVIASETSKHYEQLLFLEENLSNKIIFCEKPLFQTSQTLDMKKNKVYIGYVLRYHPLLQKLKEFVKYETIISINAKCGQYLPTWRPNQDYTDSYSAKKSAGGGVLLDLSHEIDYVQWLCGNIVDIKSYQVKISDLDIDSDDLTMVIGQTTSNVFVNISIDYISKITHRDVFIETLNNSYKLDFISNKLLKKNKIGLEERYSFVNLERNYMFEQMHKDIFKNKVNICTFDEGLSDMNTISTIQEQNNR